MVYFFYLCLGRQRANNFRGKQLRCALAAPWADFVCVLCFCQLHMWPGRGAWGVALPLFIMLHVYFMCVCVRGRGERKAALAAIRSAVTKIFCPKTLSSVNIYGAIAVHPTPPPPLVLLFYPVLTHGNENFQQNLCQGRRGMPQQSTATTNQTNGK